MNKLGVNINSLPFVRPSVHVWHPSAHQYSSLKLCIQSLEDAKFFVFLYLD